MVRVTDVNDNLPMFVKDEVSLSIPENTEQRAIHQVVAKDLDTGDNARLSYTIISTYYISRYILRRNQTLLLIKLYLYVY